MLIGFNWVLTQLIIGWVWVSFKLAGLGGQIDLGYFSTPSIIQVIKGFSTFFKHRGCFCHFLVFRRYFIHFDVLGVFRSFFMFWGCISPFLGVRCVLDIFCLSRGILVIYHTYSFWSYSI